MNTYLAQNCQCVEKAMIDACPVHDFGEAPVFEETQEACLSMAAGA